MNARMLDNAVNLRLYLKVFLSTAIALLVFEALKDWWSEGQLTLWQSHFITIVAGTCASVAASHYMHTRTRQFDQAMLLLEQEANAFNKSLIDAIPVAVFFKDREGRYLGCNRLFSEVMGVGEAQIRGKTVYDLWPSELSKTYHQKDLELMAAPCTQQYEFKVKDKNGAMLDVIYGKSVFHDASGEVAGIIGSFFDITQRKAVEQELAKYREHLETLVADKTAALDVSNRELALAKDAADASNRAKTVFLQTMAHELRTPLNAVIGMGQLLQMSRLADGQEEMAAIILSSGKSLLKMIDDILRYVEIQDGLIAAAPRPCALHEVIDGIQAGFEAQARRKGITLLTDVSDRIPDTLLLDPALLKKALDILVDNAIAFTDSGGIRIAASEKGDGRLAIEVRDTGCGMPPEVLARLFEPFYQADESATRTHGGIGLGLALAKHLVAQMGGTITVTSEPKMGSCFQIELDMRTPAGNSR